MLPIFTLLVMDCDPGYTVSGSVSLEGAAQVSFLDGRDGLSWRRASAPFAASQELASTNQNLFGLDADEIVFRTHPASNVAFVLTSTDRFELAPDGFHRVRAGGTVIDISYSPKDDYWRALIGGGSSYRVQQRNDDGMWIDKGNAISELGCTRLLTTADADSVLVCEQAIVRVGVDRVALPEATIERVVIRGNDVVIIASSGGDDGVIDSLQRYVLAPASTTWAREDLPLPPTGGTVLAADHSSILFAYDRTALAVHFEDSLGTWSTRTLFDGKALFTPERAAIVGGTVALWNQTQAVVVNPDGTYVEEAIGTFDPGTDCSGCRASGSPWWLCLVALIVFRRPSPGCEWSNSRRARDLS